MIDKAAWRLSEKTGDSDRQKTQRIEKSQEAHQESEEGGEEGKGSAEHRVGRCRSGGCAAGLSVFFVDRPSAAPECQLGSFCADIGMIALLPQVLDAASAQAPLKLPNVWCRLFSVRTSLTKPPPKRRGKSKASSPLFLLVFL
jgi:hypothetical protein